MVTNSLLFPQILECTCGWKGTFSETRLVLLKLQQQEQSFLQGSSIHEHVCPMCKNAYLNEVENPERLEVIMVPTVSPF
jgi:hypothetical protein